MKIRRYAAEDRTQQDPPHNEPGQVIEAKLKVDFLIFVAEDSDSIIGAASRAMTGTAAGCIPSQWTLPHAGVA